MAKPDPISAFLDMITCEAIGAALDQLADTDTLSPMTITATPREADRGPRAVNGKRRTASGQGKASEISNIDARLVQTVFKDDTPDVCLGAAREHIRSLGKMIDAYAIVYDGFIQESSNTPAQDALIIEFGERDARCGYSAYVMYRQPGTKEFSYGDPQPAGEGPLLLS
jgi:hypothetical protein